MIVMYADGVFRFLEEIITLLEIGPCMRLFFLVSFCTFFFLFGLMFTNNEVIGKTSCFPHNAAHFTTLYPLINPNRFFLVAFLPSFLSCRYCGISHRMVGLHCEDKEPEAGAGS